MATYLFNNVSEFKTFVGGGANLSLELDSIAPTMYMTAQQHLLPWLGSTTWDALVSGVDDDSILTDPDLLALLPYVQRPLAMLTMYEYSKIGGIQFSESGIYRMESEDMGMKSAYKYQENQYRDYMLHNGYEAIELLLIFLDDNDGTYTDWAASEGFMKTRALLINYAKEFREVYSKQVSRYTFEVLRPIIEDIEKFAFLDFLGPTQYNRLKTGLLADNLTAEEITLIGLLRRALANWAIEEGLQRHWITFQADRVIQIESLEPQSFRQDTPAAANALSLRLRQDELAANRHLSYLKSYLADNLDDYPLYLDELAAAEEAAATAEDLCNDPDYRAFPHACCTHYPYCSCSSSSRKGIVRL